MSNSNQPTTPPKPPASRIEYRGMLSSFFGPEDEFEAWKQTPRQRLVFKLEPYARMLIPALLAVFLFGGMAVQVLRS